MLKYDFGIVVPEFNRGRYAHTCGVRKLSLKKSIDGANAAFSNIAVKTQLYLYLGYLGNIWPSKDLISASIMSWHSQFNRFSLLGS